MFAYFLQKGPLWHNMIQCVLQTIFLLCECADIFNRNMKSGWQGLTFCSITVINMFTVHIAVCNLFTCISELLSASCSIKWWQVHEHFRELEIRNKLSASSRIKKKGLKIPISMSRHLLPVGCAPSESTGVGCTGAAEDAWTLGVPKLNPPNGCWGAAVVWVARPPKLKPVPAGEAPRVMLVVAGWDAAGVLSFGREALDAKTGADFSNNCFQSCCSTVTFQLYIGSITLDVPQAVRCSSHL